MVRSETHRSWVREQLGSVDFASFFASFRNVDVRVAVEGVAIGRERRAAEDDRRRSDARESAEKSVVVRQLLEAFGARIETVEPAALAARDTFASLEEDHDE